MLTREMYNGIDLDMRNGSGTHYDALGRPLYWLHRDWSGVVIGFRQAYDRAGNKTYQYSVHDPEDSFRYFYDSAYRLTQSIEGEFDPDDFPYTTTDPTTTTWTLDGVGNWSELALADGAGSSTETRLDTSFNEYYSIGGTAQSHDANGNLTNDGTHIFTWDAFNRLREVYEVGNPYTLEYYLYDAHNRRVRRDVTYYGSGVDTDFYYDGWQVIHEYENGSGSPARRFVYGNYIDEPLMMENASGDCVFYLQNPLFSVYALTDLYGDLVETYEYDPYGKQTVDGTPGAASSYGNPYMFTGRRFDPESGLMYYRMRHYDTERGRFIGRDPIGLEGGTNLAAYTGNRPNGYVDPSGEDFIAVGSSSAVTPLTASIPGGKSWRHMNLEYWRGPLPQLYHWEVLNRPLAAGELYHADLTSPINKGKIYDRATLIDKSDNHHMDSIELQGHWGFGRWERRDFPMIHLLGPERFYEWKTILIAYINDSGAGKRLHILKIGCEGELEKEWEEIQTLGHDYPYALPERRPAEIPDSRWPNAKYAWFGNNSNTFIRWLVGTHFETLYNWPIWGEHAGHLWPVPVPRDPPKPTWTSLRPPPPYL